jgi:hypothetical protein
LSFIIRLSGSVTFSFAVVSWRSSDQLGHVDAGFTLKVYRHGMRRDPAARKHLRMLVGGAQWEAMSASEAQTPWIPLAA